MFTCSYMITSPAKGNGSGHKDGYEELLGPPPPEENHTLSDNHVLSRCETYRVSMVGRVFGGIEKWFEKSTR